MEQVTTPEEALAKTKELLEQKLQAKPKEFVFDVNKVNQIKTVKKLAELVGFVFSNLDITIPETVKGFEKIKHLTKEK